MEMIFTNTVDMHLAALVSAKKARLDRHNCMVKNWQDGDLQSIMDEKEYKKESEQLSGEIDAITVELDGVLRFTAEYLEKYRLPGERFQGLSLYVRPAMEPFREANRVNFLIWKANRSKLEFYLFNQNGPDGARYDLKLLARPSYNGSYLVCEVRNEDGWNANFSSHWPSFADVEEARRSNAVDRSQSAMTLDMFACSAFRSLLMQSYERKAVECLDGSIL